VGFRLDEDSDVEGEEGQQAVHNPEKSILAKKGGPAAATAEAEESKQAPALSKSVKWFD